MVRKGSHAGAWEPAGGVNGYPRSVIPAGLFIKQLIIPISPFLPIAKQYFSNTGLSHLKKHHESTFFDITM